MSIRFRICCLTVKPNDLVDEEVLRNTVFIEPDQETKALYLWFKGSIVED